MKVSRLEIFGFKSFLDRLVLPLDGGITGIVGPNGCGKSNIVDALRWILGETRARNLRGGTLEDVIFNGTDKLRPLGLAEVTLTFRASDDGFFADLLKPESGLFLSNQIENELGELGAEAAIAEADQISDESAASCDEKDDRPKLTVIDGGKNFDSGAEANSTDVEPEIVTEKIVAEAAVPPFLSRFSWLKAVSEVQVTRRLYRSGESEFFINRVPCRLKDIKELFRVVGLGARASTIVAQGEVARIISAKPEDRRLFIEEAAGVMGFRDKIAAAKSRLEDTAVNISRLEDVIREVTRQVSVLKRQAQRAENRAELKSQILHLDTELFVDGLATINEHGSHLLSSLSEYETEEGDARAKLEAVQAAEHDARSKLMTVDVEGDALRIKIDAIREELSNRSKERSERTSRINQVRAYRQANEAEGGRLLNSHASFVERRESIQKALEQLELNEAELRNSLSALDVQNDDGVSNMESEVERLSTSLKNTERESRALRDELVRLQSARDATVNQIAMVSPENQFKQTLGTESATGLFGAFGSLTLVADYLSVPEQYARAVQATLAEKAHFVVSDKPFEIAKAFVSEVEAGRGKIKGGHGLGVCALHANLAIEETADQVPFVRLIDLITVKEEASGLVRDLLRGVYLADTLADAVAFFSKASPNVSRGVRVVTLSGDIIDAHSYFGLRHEGGVVQLHAKVDGLTTKIDEIEVRRSEIDAQVADLSAQLEAVERRLKEARIARETRAQKVRDLSKELAKVEGYLQGERKSLQRVESDIASIVKNQWSIEEKDREYEEEERRIEKEILALQPEDDTALQSELAKLKADYDKLDEARRSERRELSNLALSVDEARRKCDELRQRVSDTRFEQEKIRIETDSIKERFVAEHGIDSLDALVERASLTTLLEDGVRNEYREELSRLKARIQREGDVDPESIVRYTEENDRLNHLVTQRQDLEEAQATLKATIARLSETSEKRFVAVFNRVRQNFSQLVPRLFGGGRGSLELLDPAHPLESGIEIIARPPGKKLKSIDLMSGGEKALCATALILAMFMERPSPICVLDEVDAPLDEANLVRFMTLIKEMSTKTQFLVITHNKHTMSVSDNLVGVTMQEPGASRVLTVSLQEAYSQVA